MKKVTYLFWSVVGAIGVTFGLSVFTAVTASQKAKDAAPVAIPTPAVLPTQ